nr:methanogen output domain 1-containing protein [Pseudotabrizicola algicola]
MQDAELGPVLVDLKAKIDGGFRIEEDTASSLVFFNDKCPFGSRVEGRQSLCMMTSNVFGFIASQCKGYAKVELEKTIAAGDGMCRVKLHFNKNTAPGREYYRIENTDG